ncbi:MAG: carboxylating nicotinate-nucleotide diphosphorylase [Nitrospiria bacterium]
MIEPVLIDTLVRQGLAEDLCYGDRTTEALFPSPIPAVGEVIAKEALIVAGTEIFQAVFQRLDPHVLVESISPPGTHLKKGALIARVTGDARVILKGERTALNFLQHLSGIATLTAEFVKQTQGTSATIVDTRKTIPGYRVLEKEAVRLGGGGNHRFHLGDLILIKDNHIALGRDIQAIVKMAHAAKSHTLKIELEVGSMAEVREAIKAGVEIIMLDNMSLEEIREAVRFIREKNPALLIEASGGVSLNRVAAISACGVDLISVGALTHSARAVDISMKMKTIDERLNPK